MQNHKDKNNNLVLHLITEEIKSSMNLANRAEIICHNKLVFVEFLSEMGLT